MGLVAAAILVIGYGSADRGAQEWISRALPALHATGDSPSATAAAEPDAEPPSPVIPLVPPTASPASYLAAAEPEPDGSQKTSNSQVPVPDVVAGGADGAGEDGAEELPPAIARAQARGPDDHWEVFFTPFRSEASAQGFAGFLQSATGREFVVRRMGPGDYRVWFSMAPGESRPQRLAEIEAATGMVLAGGEL